MTVDIVEVVAKLIDPAPWEPATWTWPPNSVRKERARAKARAAILAIADNVSESSLSKAINAGGGIASNEMDRAAMRAAIRGYLQAALRAVGE